MKIRPWCGALAFGLSCFDLAYSDPVYSPREQVPSAKLAEEKAPQKTPLNIPSVAESRKAPYPILALAHTPFQDIYLRQILRDEAIYTRPLGMTQLGYLQEKLTGMREQMITVDPAKKINFLRSYMDDLLLLSYYWADVTYARTESLASPPQAFKEMVQTHKDIIRIAEEIMEKTSSAAERDKMRYYLAMIYFQYVDKRLQARSMIAQLLKSPSLGSSQRFSLSLMQNLVWMRARDPQVVAKAYHFFDSLSHHSNHYIATLANLILADHLSQTPQTGMLQHKHVAEHTAQLGSYRVLLKFVSSTCNQFTYPEKRELLNAAISIWTNATDFKQNWRNMPFYLTCFENQPKLASLFERIALQYWQQGSFVKSKANYQILHQSIRQENKKRLLNQRVVELSRILYFQNGETAEYQNLMIESEKQYPNSLYAIKLAEFHYEMVNREIAKAFQDKGNTAQIAKAESVAGKFLTSRSFTRHQFEIAARLAQVYKLNDMHRQAAETYKMMAAQGSAKKTNQYLKQAIMEQALYAGWDLQDPFALYGEEKSLEREELLRLFYRYKQKLSTPSDWFVESNIGMLELNLNRLDAALATLQPVLKRKPRGLQAQKSLGHLLAFLLAVERWPEVETMVDLGLQYKTEAIYIGKRYDLHALREQALYMQAKAYSQAKDYARALTYLQQLTAQYAQQPRIEEYYYLQGINLADSGQFVQAIRSFKKVTEKGSRSEFFEKSLLHTARLALGMTLIDEAIANYTLYLQAFGDKEEAHKVRLRLSEIYIALSRHEQALTTLAKIPTDGALSNRVEDLRSQILNIFQSVGYGPQALSRSQMIVASTEYSDQLKARAYMILARHALEQRRLDRLEELESGALNLNQSSLAVKDALSYIWYAQVSLTSGLFTKQVSKYFVQHHREALLNIKNSFQKLKTSHLTVCKQAHAAYCIPSLQALMKIGQNFIATMMSIDIPESDASLVEYHAEKKKLVEFLQAEMTTIQAQVVANSAIGNTKPSITQQILWSYNYDWNFHHNLNAGVGFIQIHREKNKL
ncbi:MAG: tetratricopeptide repeat protein [Zetaproteobacteria bacterium]|nr:tetratricopeptide repeat protein [Zetaproteobacteria bacterium]